MADMLLIVSVKTSGFAPVPVVLIGPLKKLEFAGWQGLAKVDCATECLGPKNWNTTVSPILALKSLGEKLSPPLPTATVWTVEEPELVWVAAGAVVDVLESDPP
jgi:hypothetical protein